MITTFILAIDNKPRPEPRLSSSHGNPTHDERREVERPWERLWLINWASSMNHLNLFLRTPLLYEKFLLVPAEFPFSAYQYYSQTSYNLIEKLKIGAYKYFAVLKQTSVAKVWNYLR